MDLHVGTLPLAINNTGTCLLYERQLIAHFTQNMVFANQTNLLNIKRKEKVTAVDVEKTGMEHLRRHFVFFLSFFFALL